MATQVSQTADRVSNKYELYIDNELEKTRGRIKFVDLCTGLFTMFGWALATLLVFAVIDGWIWPLGLAGRITALAILVAGLLAIGSWFVLPLLLRKINPQYAARMIEKSKPRFKNSLLNYLWVKASGQDVNRSVAGAISHRAATDLSDVSASESVDQSRLIRAGFIVVALAVAVIGYAMMSPKSPLPTFARVLNPFSDVSRPAIARVVSVTPGDAKVYFGDALHVEAEIKGRHEAGDVRLIFSTDDGQYIDSQIGMLALSNRKYTCELKTASTGIQQDLKYKVIVLDGESRWYTVKVLPQPAVSIESIEIRPPEYTGLPDRVITTTGEVSSVEGAKVLISAVTNMSAKTAHIEFLRPEKAGDLNSLKVVKSHPIDIRDKKLLGIFHLTLNADRDAPSFTHYQLRFSTAEGDYNQKPNTYPVKITPDIAPQVEFVDPRNSEVSLPVNGSLNVQIEAMDIDYEISSVDLQIDNRGLKILGHSFPLPPKKDLQRVNASYWLVPEQLGLKPGDQAIMFASASDNRHSPYSGLIDPNTSKTESVTITITEPDSRIDEQKRDREIEQDKQQQEREQQEQQDNQDQDNGNQDAQEQAGQEGEEGQEQDQTGDGSGGSEQQSEDSQTNQEDSTGNDTEGEMDSDGQESGNEENQASDDQNQSEQSGSEGEEQGTQQSDGSGNTENEGTSQQQENSGNPSGAQNSGGENQNQSNQDSQGSGGSEGQEQAENSGNDNSESQEQGSENGGKSTGDDGQQQDGDPDGTGGQEDQNLQSGSRISEDSTDGERFEELEKYLAEKEKQQQSEENSQSSDGDQTEPVEENNSEEGSEQSDSEGSEQSGSEQSGSEGSEQSGSEGSEQSGSESGSEGSEQSGSEGSEQSGSEGSEQSGSEGSEQSGSEGSEQSGSEGSEQSGSEGSEQTGSEGSEQSGSEGSEQSGSEGSEQSGSEGSEQSGSEGSEQSGSEGSSQTGSQSHSGSEGSASGSGSDGSTQEGEGSEGNQRNQSGDGAENQRPGNAANPNGVGQSNFETAEQEKANLDFTKKATDLVLDDLRNQANNPDQELLDRMNWTQEDLRDFLNRWEKMRDAADKGSLKDKKRFESALKSLGLRPGGTTSRDVQSSRDQEFGLSEEGAINRPTSEWAEQFNAFMKLRNQVERNR